MSAKCALVTGASRGFGRATAERLSASGSDLILLARREERLLQQRADLEKRHKIKVTIAAVDVRDKSQIEKFVHAHQSALAQTDVLINNAGLAKGGDKLSDGKLADWDEMIDTNIKGLLYISRAVIPFMLNQQKGHIVNIGSVAGRWVYPGGAVYCATKFAVRALSEGLRMDLFGTPLRVTNIEPGLAETEFSQVRFNDVDRAKAVYKGVDALQANDVAESILWCLQRPQHVNIQELVIFPTQQAAIQQIHRRDSAKPV